MPEKDSLVPAVPAQEAPRECKWCKQPVRKLGGLTWIASIGGPMCPDNPNSHAHEPQAGAQPKVYVVSPQEVEEYVEVAPGEFERCEPQAGAQVPSQELTEDQIISQLYVEIAGLRTHLNSIKSYATEAAKTPITRESILAAPQVITASTRTVGSSYNEWAATATNPDIQFRDYLVERIARLEEEVEARKLIELAQYDEMQGLCRLILSESGGSK